MSTILSRDRADDWRLYALFVAVIILWGVNWPIIKIGLQYIGPLWFSALRFVMGVACFLVIGVMSGRLRLPHREDWPVIASVGFLQMGVYVTLVNLGLLHVGAGRAAVLAYTTPLWVAPGAAFFLAEKLSARAIAGLFLGLGGIAILFNPAGFDWHDNDVVLGNGLIMLGAVGWAGAILHIRGHRWQGRPLDLAVWQMGLAAIMLVPIAAVVEDWGAIRWTPELGLALLYNGPVTTAFCFWGAVTVSRHLPATTTSLSFLGVPVTAVIAATIWTGEELDLHLVTGLVAIIAGILAINWKPRRPA